MTPSLLTQVRKFADLNTNAILDPDCHIFSVSEIDGLLGYKLKENCAIVFGDPLCNPSDKLKLGAAFKEYCKAKKLNIIYTMISEGFAKRAINILGTIAIEIGDKIVLKPSDSPMNKTGEKASLVRRKVKHALKSGITISEYISEEKNLENQMQDVAKKWLNERKGPQIHLASPTYFQNRFGKRWFYAKLGEQIIGFLILNEVQSEDGWLLNNVITTPDAPGGTSELLIIKCLEKLNEEECSKVITGPVTTKNIKSVIGGRPFTAFVLKVVYKISKKIFELDRQAVFWDKFQAKTEKSYIMFDKVNIKAFKALFSALNVKF